MIANPLNEYALAFPILECIHIVGFAFSVGTIALVDFRLLNLWMLHQTPAFLIKMVCLLAAIVFNYTIHHTTAQTESPASNGKLVASISLALWGAVIFDGIFIAFINPGLT